VSGEKGKASEERGKKEKAHSYYIGSAWLGSTRVGFARLPKLFCADRPKGARKMAPAEKASKRGDRSRSAGRELKIVAPPLHMRLSPALSFLCPRGPRAELEAAGIKRGRRRRGAGGRGAAARTPAGGAGGRGRRARGPAVLRWRSQGPTGGAGGRGVRRNGAVGRFPAARIRGSRGRDGGAGTGKLEANGRIGGAT
jgi:hypothetical protein